MESLQTSMGMARRSQVWGAIKRRPFGSYRSSRAGSIFTDSALFVSVFRFRMFLYFLAFFAL